MTQPIRQPIRQPMRHSRGRTVNRSHGLRFAAATLSLGALVAGCGGSDGGSEGDESTADTAVAASGRAGVAKTALDQDRGGVNRAGVQTRSVISTGRITLTSNGLGQTRDDVDDLLLAMGGSIDSERTSHDAAGRIERSTLVLRVPVASFTAAMDALEKLGKVEASNSRSEDVTTQVIDMNERVETLENSLDRLQKFQRQSDNIDDLILFESQITERESELRSLQRQQAFLDDQTAMSTITVDLSTPATYIAPPDALADAGFLAGLRSGWSGLTNLVVVALTAFGAMLPFALALALAGVPMWLLARASRRHRTAPPTTPPTPHAG